ncbi:MAG TPA: hypothetical protein VI341_12140 [Actinomycetota bacterium]
MHALLEFLQDIGSNFVEFFNIRQQTDLPRTQDSTDEAEDPAEGDLRRRSRHQDRP